MARHAMVQDVSGIVVNVIEWDGSEDTWQAPAGYTMILDDQVQASPGFSWDGEAFKPPPGGEPG